MLIAFKAHKKRKLYRVRAASVKLIEILEGQNKQNPSVGCSSQLKEVYDALKLKDANIIVKYIIYARQRSFEYWDKPGERLAYVLSEDYVTSCDCPMRSGEGL